MIGRKCLPLFSCNHWEERAALLGTDHGPNLVFGRKPEPAFNDPPEITIEKFKRVLSTSVNQWKGKGLALKIVVNVMVTQNPLWKKKFQRWCSICSSGCFMTTYQLESCPVLWNSAHGLSLFLMELSECAAKAFLISSILIRRGLSRDRQNKR